MVCEQQLDEWNRAILPLAGHIATVDAKIAAVQQAHLDLDQAVAVVNSDLQNIAAKRLLYDQCVMQQNQPPGPIVVSPMHKAFGHLQTLQVMQNTLKSSLNAVRHNADQLKRIDMRSSVEKTKPSDFRPGM